MWYITWWILRSMLFGSVATLVILLCATPSLMAVRIQRKVVPVHTILVNGHTCDVIVDRARKELVVVGSAG